MHVRKDEQTDARRASKRAGANITELTQARFTMLKHITFPAMTAQTEQRFIWIIFTDPFLVEDIREQIIAFLAPYPHMRLVPFQSREDTRREHLGMEALEKEYGAKAWCSLI